MATQDPSSDTSAPGDSGALSGILAGAGRWKYEVGGLVAQGGMGAILSARDANLRRDVAMKVILGGQDAPPDRILRFVEEAQVTGQLEHPSIIPIYELGVDTESNAFYTMKFVKGVSLQAILHDLRNGRADTIAKYPLGHLLVIFQKICDAMAFAHARGVIHRDLKPENVMIGDYGEVLVMDWGLAKILGRAERPGQPVAAVVSSRTESGEAFRTMEGRIMGTPGFMSPEQAMGMLDSMDARTDIYALGAILYNILTLRVPIGGETFEEILARITTGDIALPISFNPGDSKHAADRIRLHHCPNHAVPESLSAVAMKALSVRASDRYGNVAELQREIAAYLGGFATSAEHAGAWKQLKLLVRRHRVETGLVAAGFLILVTVVSAFVFKVHTERNKAMAALRDLQKTAPAFFNQAQLFVKEKNFNFALDKITYAIQLVPEDPEYHNLRGDILESLLNLKDAAAEYSEALRLRPDHPRAAENLKLCEKLLKDNSGRRQLLPASLAELQELMRRQGRSDEAIAMGQRAGGNPAQALAFWKDVLERSHIAGTLTVDDKGQLNLVVTDTKVQDLTPIAEMPLLSLTLEGSAIQDLAPLRAMPLSSLNLRYSKVRDLSPLKGRPLASLDVSNTAITDLSPLGGMPLTRLSLYGCSVSDLSPLKGMPLRRLSIASSAAKDLAPLQGMPLEFLAAGATAIEDLQPLKGMPLVEFEAGGTKVNDLAPLQNLPLKRLMLNATPVGDLRRLRGLELTVLDIASTAVTDLSPIEGMPLETLNIAATKIGDLKPLRGMPLSTLVMDRSAITNLGPLEGLPLQLLNVADTRVSDIRVLKNLPLRELHVDRCDAIPDLAPIADCRSLEKLCVSVNGRNLGALRALQSLKFISFAYDGWKTTADEFWKQFDAKAAESPK